MSSPQKTDAERIADANEIIRRKNNEIQALKGSVAKLQREEDTAAEIRRVIFGLAEHTPEPPTWLSGKGGHSGSRGAPVTIWSDFHYGERIDPSQIGGVNEYNTTIAKKRVHKLVDTTIDLAFNHMGTAKTVYPGIIIALGGDMISGNIHDELAETNDRTPWQAVNDLTDLLAGCVDKMATKFGNVYLPCVVGNHGRGTHKPRFKNRVFTSFDWSIYTNLERHFKDNKHIRFSIPSEADAHFNVFGHRHLLTHGDALGVKGGDGIIGALGPVARGAIKIGRAEAQIGRDFDTLVMGHFHQTLWLPGIHVNNSLKGFDEFAMLAMRAKYSRPSQSLWFVHPEHGITARWEVFLEGIKKAAQSKEWVTWR